MNVAEFQVQVTRNGEWFALWGSDSLSQAMRTMNIEYQRAEFKSDARTIDSAGDVCGFIPARAAVLAQGGDE